ncbi:MAG: histidine kinase, partial [Bacteroidia bacterium]|nr:histidine kinase [Bacteroidia bacterium]
IHEDVNRADRFLKALSKNLRYVLEQNKDVVVTLRKEIEFIQSYIYLQEERFGQKLKVDIDVKEEQMEYELPALTLELLIENALKHNIVSKSKPMRINVKVEDDQLVVINSYQPKTDGVVSTGIGLNNLKQQLQLLGLDGAIFGAAGDQYIARIPMLKLPKK